MASAPQLEQDTGGGEAVNDAAPSVEDIAIEGGWKPKDQYTGDPEKWKPAAEYVRGTFQIRDHFKGSARGFKAEVERLTKTVDNLVQTGAKQTAKALEKQAAEIAARRDAAVANKDAVAAVQADRDLQSLVAEAREAIPDPKNAEADFASRNDWYGKDRKATAFAKQVCQDAAASGVSDLGEQLKIVDAEMRKEYPELYTDAAPPGRKQQASVAEPARGQAASRKDYSSLQPEIKKAGASYVDMFIAKGLIPASDRDKALNDYAKDYYGLQ